jgi:hypothetical protein
MTGIDTDTARNETLARLAASRAEIRRILEPPPRGSSADSLDSGGSATGGFPRSRTMRMLLSSRGAGTVGAVAFGLVVARPALAFRLLRMLPTGAIGRMLLAKAIWALRSNPRSQSKRE